MCLRWWWYVSENNIKHIYWVDLGYSTNKNKQTTHCLKSSTVNMFGLSTSGKLQKEKNAVHLST